LSFIDTTSEPAVFLLHRDAVQAELAHRRPQLLRKPVLAVRAFGERGDLLVGEAGRSVTDHLGALAELEIEIGSGAQRKSPAGRAAHSRGPPRQANASISALCAWISFVTQML
jgi:hypothetical protein